MPLTTLTKKYGIELVSEEIRLEEHYKELAQKALKETIRLAKVEGQASQVSVGKKLVCHGFAEAKEGVKIWYDKVCDPKSFKRPKYYGILQDLQTIFTTVTKKGESDFDEDALLDLLTFIPLSALINGIGSTEVIVNNVAQVVLAELQEEAKVEEFVKTLDKFNLEALQKGVDTRVSRHYKVAFARQLMVKKKFVWTPWNKNIGINMCFQLIHVVAHTSGFFVIESGEDTKVESEVTTKSIQYSVTPTEWLLEAWEKNTSNLISNTSRNMPMVVPPLPWNGLHDGGYIGSNHGRHSLLRSESLRGGNGNSFTKKYLQRLEEVDISRVQKAVNLIQETPWRINKGVFHVLESIMKMGGNMAGVPHLNPLEQLPRLPKDTPEDVLKAHKKAMWNIYRDDIKRKAIAHRANGHFNIAKDFSKYDKIYFPYNMDFRGRVYPISSFSPQSDDLNKALLEFVSPPPCTDKEDIKWLMIHGANVAGVDKVSFEDREAWVLENETHILESAKNPLDYLWWTEQDDSCFQLLAFCFEWLRFREYEEIEGSCVGFVCNIPIAFDGTCSGLQHYSAILRDPIGGKAVNLVPQELPNDIYRVVADKINEAVKVEALTGTEDEIGVYKNEETGEERETIRLGTKTLAQQWLAFGITRNVTKRSVMTLPYGSKEYGFRAQILKDVIEVAQADKKGGMFIKPVQASNYMAKHIWVAVQTVVVKAMLGMKYLQKLSQVVCKSGHVITWTSPMGLPISQAYMVEKVDKIRLRIMGTTVIRNGYVTTQTGNVDKKAQVSGIAPNFIHCMDASHLQLTVLNASEKYNISHFALIHDSFGAPLSQSSTMFKVIRESFLQLYSENDVLANFHKELSVYVDEGEELPSIPKYGKLNLEEVLDSKYMFA